jgi:hypothetical protein
VDKRYSQRLSCENARARTVSRVALTIARDISSCVPTSDDARIIDSLEIRPHRCDRMLRRQACSRVQHRSRISCGATFDAANDRIKATNDTRRKIFSLKAFFSAKPRERVEQTANHSQIVARHRQVENVLVRPCDSFSARPHGIGGTSFGTRVFQLNGAVKMDASPLLCGDPGFPV